MHRLWVLASHWAATWPTCTRAWWPRGVSSGASPPPSCQSLLSPPNPPSCRAAGQGQLRERGAPQLLFKQDLLASPGVFHGPGLGRDAVQGPKPSEPGRAWGVGLGPASG